MPILLIFIILVSNFQPKIDFGNEKVNNWVKINDTVMGGLSSSKIDYMQDYVVFSGKLSLENNGGFVSFRTNFGRYDLSKFKGVKLKYKTSGEEFGLMIEDQRIFYYPYYLSKLEPSKKWKEATLLWKDFSKYRLGENQGGSPNSEFLENAIRFGFINTSKNQSEFTLEIDYIEFIQ